MKTIRFIFPIVVLLLVNVTAGFSNVTDVPSGIFTAFKTGNSKALASYFNSSIELVILDKEDVYSKTQAEQIVKEFFAKHKPLGFTKLHEGGKDGAKYVIGNLKTSNGTYRVYFLLKNRGGKQYIHQLRIEEDDEQ
jgi:hypothetical protein